MSTKGTEDKERALSIITVNTGYRTGKGNGEIRRREISELLKNENPTIVLLQMFVFKKFNVGSSLWKEYKVPDKYTYLYREEEASFLYDKNKLTVESLDEENEKNADIIRDELRTDERLQIALGRMPMVVAKTTTGNARFLCVSFHGLYKIDDERKWLELEAMLMLVAKVSEKMKIPFIIGGGFNLNIRDASDFLKDKKLPVPIVVHDYKALSRRDLSLKRDFFIGSKSIALENIRPYDWNSGIFYHDPVVATFKVDDQYLEIIKDKLKKEIKEKKGRKEIKDFLCNKKEIKKQIQEEIKKEIQEKLDKEIIIEEIKEDIMKRAIEGVKKEIKEEIKEDIKGEIKDEIKEEGEEIKDDCKEEEEKEIKNEIIEEEGEEIKDDSKGEEKKEIKNEIIEDEGEEIKDDSKEEEKKEIKNEIIEEEGEEIKGESKKEEEEEDIVGKNNDDVDEIIKTLKEEFEKKIEDQLKKEVKEEIIEEIMKEMKRDIIEGFKDKIEEEILEEIKREIKDDIKEDIIKKLKEEKKKKIKETIKKELEDKIKNTKENEKEKGPST